MKPYIETATETQTLEMEKWNRNQYRSQIISLLDNAEEKDLQKALSTLQKLFHSSRKANKGISSHTQLEKN